MRSLLLSFVFFFVSTAIMAQVPDDPESMLNSMSDSAVAEKVIATFKSTRIVNSQSIENVSKHVLDFRIMHRFGAINTGAYELFGLDNASMRLGFEYGITNNLMVGLGRSTIGKTFDGFVKYKILAQTVGGTRNIPVTLSVFGSTTYKTLRLNTVQDKYNTGKLAYVTQILIGRKFNERLSLQLTPSYIHRNLVETKAEKNDVIAMGFGGRYKINRSVAINFDYFYTLPNQLASKYTNPLTIGVDIETGGHVFQLHVSNSNGLVEKQFIGETTGKWYKGDIMFGFNISRVFTIGSHTRYL